MTRLSGRCASILNGLASGSSTYNLSYGRCVPEKHASKSIGSALILDFLRRHPNDARSSMPAQPRQLREPFSLVDLSDPLGKAYQLGHFLAVHRDHYFLSPAGQPDHLRQFRLCLSQGRGHVVTVVTNWRTCQFP